VEGEAVHASGEGPMQKKKQRTNLEPTSKSAATHRNSAAPRPVSAHEHRQVIATTIPDNRVISGLGIAQNIFPTAEGIPVDEGGLGPGAKLHSRPSDGGITDSSDLNAVAVREIDPYAVACELMPKILLHATGYFKLFNSDKCTGEVPN
jgi:hypothetical protein